MAHSSCKRVLALILSLFMMLSSVAAILTCTVTAATKIE